MILAGFRSQWVKLRRRSLMGGTYIALFALAGLFTVLVFARAGAAGGDFVSLAELAQPNGLARGLSRAAILLGIVAFGVAASQIAVEFSLGTLRQLLVRQPRRVILLTGESLAIMSFILGAVAAAAIGGGIASLVMAHLRGVPTAAWTTASGFADLGRALGDIALASLGYCILGILVGLLLRSPAPAVIVGFVYLLPFEGIFGAVVKHANRWLPGSLLGTIAQGGSDTVKFAPALLTSIVYVAIAALLAAFLFKRRDVTA